MQVSSRSAIARRLASALEPVVGQVYFAPECHRNYEALGFDPSPGDANGVAMPEWAAYFTSRGSLLGQVPGEVVAAAFGVFSRDVVVPAVTRGWELTDATTIRAARADGARRQLERLATPAGDDIERARALLRRAVDVVAPNGRALAAGAISWPEPDDGLAAVWHFGDVLREFRGDSHNATWVAAGLTACEIGLSTELYWGMPARSYSRTRGWTVDEFDAAEEHLRSLGHLADGDDGRTVLTDSGRDAREQLEVATDEQMRPVLDALGEGADELVQILTPWGAAVRAGAGYPASGPHDLA